MSCSCLYYRKRFSCTSLTILSTHQEPISSVIIAFFTCDKNNKILHKVTPNSREWHLVEWVFQWIVFPGGLADICWQWTDEDRMSARPFNYNRYSWGYYLNDYTNWGTIPRSNRVSFNFCFLTTNFKVVGFFFNFVYTCHAVLWEKL